MKKIKQRFWILLGMAGIFVLMTLGLTAPVLAGDLPDHIKKAVKAEYPEAVITTSRYEKWQGRMVYEVEIQTRDDKALEVIVSTEGTILDVEEEKGLPWIGGELSLGGAVMVESEIYRGMDSEIQPTFFLRYENGPIEIQAVDSLDITYSFYPSDAFEIALKGSLFFDEGYDPDDSAYLKGMDKLDTLYSAGVEVTWNFSGWELGFEVMQDISGEHDGRQAELSIEYPWNAGEFEFTPGLSLTWMDKDMTDYFYGVSSREAGSNRMAYSPDSGFELDLSLMVQYPLYGNFTAVGLAGITAYSSEITDSPLVDEDYSAQIVFGIMYTF